MLRSLDRGKPTYPSSKNTISAEVSVEQRLACGNLIDVMLFPHSSGLNYFRLRPENPATSNRLAGST